MKFQKPIVFLDIESACPGFNPDPARDKIVTLAMTKLVLNEPPLDCLFSFNPGFAMSPENMAIHGITNEQAALWPLFQNSHAAAIADFLKDCDVAGYNHVNYDVPLLWEECWRVSIELDFSKSRFVDVGNIFKKKEERGLSAAVRFYCNREHVGAHGAATDVLETVNVLEAQLVRYPDLGAMSIEELSKFSLFDDRLDLAGKIVRGPDGEPVFNFGKQKGVKVRHDPGFAQWILSKDFSENTKRVIRNILRTSQNQDDLNF